MKLNIGSGMDYREGFVNIDGSDKLPRVDKVMEITPESLIENFEQEEVTYIVCKDFIEHFHHWEGVNTMKACYKILEPNGTIWVQVPNTVSIINSNLPMDRKIRYLYGNQDVNGPGIPYSETRNKFPQFHSHRYGWTPNSMTNELKNIGFKSVHMQPAGLNFITTGVK